jgi:hypothetical protein
VFSVAGGLAVIRPCGVAAPKWIPRRCRRAPRVLGRGPDVLVLFSRLEDFRWVAYGSAYTVDRLRLSLVARSGGVA